MTNQQAPEALRLAEELEMPIAEFPTPTRLEQQAAAELRRLHYENERLAALVEAQQPAPTSQAAKFTKIIQSWCDARCLPMPSADDCQSLLLSWEAARTQADSQPAQFVDQTSANLSDKAVCASTVIDKPARDRTPEDSVMEDAARLEALHAAVTAIYLDASSDFKSALGAVVRHLDPKLAGDLLAWPKRAYDISLARLDAARKQGGAT